ncbi:MAG TPA: AbrB family transcriptional regulator [Desulfotomaculum sp.]|jgi:AbrB family looped-hinge helix DNA binding protein|nr:AbrB family transcriptional regulator [Desulfotomaculum sp.]HCJ78745.1 AbrB family transcriptional regulator [Desulfotomaculum sp.]
MANQIAVRIDNKGRVTLPKNIRQALGVDTGDTVFLKYEPEGNLVRMSRAVEDPIAVLWEHAEKEYQAGKTKDLRDYAREQGLTDVLEVFGSEQGPCPKRVATGPSVA